MHRLNLAEFPFNTKSLAKLLIGIERCWVPDLRIDSYFPLLESGTALFNRERERLLGVDIKARLHGMNADQGTRMCRCRHDDAVELL